MRLQARLFLAWLCTLLAAGAAQGQFDVRITDVRVGFSKGNDDYFKAGKWVPVAVDIEVGDQDFVGRLYVEASDAEGVSNRYILPETPGVFLSRQEKTRTLLSYVRIGDMAGSVTVTLQGRYGGREVRRTFHYPEQRSPFVPTTPLYGDTPLILGIGQPQGLDIDWDAVQGQESGSGTGRPLYRVAFQTDLGRLPEHWFGYESVDVVVLTTGGGWQGSIAQQLMLDSRRLQALETWVRFGGHLVVTTASNGTMVANPRSFPLEPLLPADIDPEGTLRVERMAGLRELVQRLPADRRLTRDEISSLGPVEMARLTPRPFARARATEPGPGLPSVVQGPYGLGKVTLVAIDTDTGPFSSWANNRDFWVALLDLRRRQGTEEQRQAPAFAGVYGTDLASRLADALEKVPGVRVVPFWWVAVFILLYIVVVGPLDYLVLKKLMKRLTGAERMEWTWFTFPSVVLLVSVGAYYLTFYLKGGELRINKVDLVEMDLDPRTQRMYGNTWFVLFSPRLQHYNLSLEPTGLRSSPETMTLSWMSRPGLGARSLGRRGESLLRRSYESRENASLLYGVPIHVWSLKSFHARWEAKLDPAQPPLSYDLQVKQKQLVGTLTNRMPWELIAPHLIYGDRVVILKNLAPGESVEVSGEWREFRHNIALTGGSVSGIMHTVGQMMFFDKLPRSSGENHDHWGYLDQSGRLDFPASAILAGRLPPISGEAASVNSSSFLGTRFSVFDPELRGVYDQHTVVRLYLPLKRE